MLHIHTYTAATNTHIKKKIQTKIDKNQSNQQSTLTLHISIMHLCIDVYMTVKKQSTKKKKPMLYIIRETSQKQKEMRSRHEHKTK